jgi:hypothetical protein
MTPAPSDFPSSLPLSTPPGRARRSARAGARRRLRHRAMDTASRWPWHRLVRWGAPALALGGLALPVPDWWKAAAAVLAAALLAVAWLVGRHLQAEPPRLIGVAVTPERIVPWEQLPAAVRDAIGPALPAGHAVWACSRLGVGRDVAQWWWVDELGEIQGRWPAGAARGA